MSNDHSTPSTPSVPPPDPVSGSDEALSLRIMRLEARVDALSREMWDAIRDRDEARREYCQLLSDLYRGEGEPPHPVEVAESRGWDCYGTSP